MKKKFLIIEDDANILYGLQAKFNVSGFDTAIDNGGFGIHETIYRIIEEKPNYIILDLILPDIDGFDLLHNIKGNRDISDIPVFVFTNLSDDGTKELVDKIGGDYYFLKHELNIDQFTEKIFKIIKNKENLNINT